MSKGRPQGEFLLYQSEDGLAHIRVLLDGETVWLTQMQMVELFQTTKQNISLHIRNILDEGELYREATVKDYLTVRREGKRNVRHNAVVLPVIPAKAGIHLALKA